MGLQLAQKWNIFKIRQKPGWSERSAILIQTVRTRRGAGDGGGGQLVRMKESLYTKYKAKFTTL